MTRLTLLPTIKVTEPHHPTLDLPKPKDWSVMLLKIKQLETQQTPFSTLKDLLVVNLATLLWRKIAHCGPSRLKPVKVTNQELWLNIKESRRNSKLKKFPLWFWPKWEILLKTTSLNQLNMPLSLFLLISMTVKDKPLKMQELLLDLMFLESLMNQPLPLLLTVWTKLNKMLKETFWSSIWEEVLLMFLSYPSTEVSSKSKPPLVTPI